VQLAEGFSQRIEFKHETTTRGGRDDNAEWSAAFKFKEKQAELDGRDSTPSGAGGLLAVDTDPTWQQGGSSASAVTREAHAVVAAQHEQRQEWQHMVPLDVPGVERVLAALRDAKHAGVAGYDAYFTALVSALANRLEDFVPITVLREPDGCGPRRYGAPFSPLDAPPSALAIMLGAGKFDCLRMHDATVEGALVLRLLQKHVHLQRQFLSGNSLPEPDAPPPSSDELLRRLQAAQQREADLKASVQRGDYSPDTLRDLAAATEARQAADAALQAHGSQASSSTSGGGGGSAGDGVLPSTAALEALLRSGSDAEDCTEVSRAVVTGSLPPHTTLSPAHEEVRSEVDAVVDALVAKGCSDWQAGLREKLNNRKKGELKKLSGDAKTRKEQELKRWARKALLERLVDDAVLLVETWLAELNDRRQYVQFVDTRDCTNVRLYVPREPDLNLRRDDPQLEAEVPLPSIGATVKLRVDNKGLEETADGMVSRLGTRTAAHARAPAGGEAVGGDDSDDSGSDAEMESDAAVEAEGGGSEDEGEGNGEEDEGLSGFTVSDSEEDESEESEDEGEGDGVEDESEESERVEASDDNGSVDERARENEMAVSAEDSSPEDEDITISKRRNQTGRKRRVRCESDDSDSD
jgi:hypothetical protein